eukprot:GHVP01068768.1.p1 GENE.GHVP01068768.1~~GHVP01068768.1.p1  ORF type:complete len:245 (+),score=32.81 GHVP01068768.1:27-737(+)
MEFKTFLDQLNSACEEYFGVSQANGLPLQDDLYQGKSIEPQFQGGLRYGDFGHTLSFRGTEVKSNVEKIVERLKSMEKHEEFDDYYELREYRSKAFFRCNLMNYIGVRFEAALEYDDDKTLVYFDNQDVDGRRFWIFGLCNCEEESGNCEGEERRCFRFSITWKQEQERERYAKMNSNFNKNAKQKARELYEYFECYPQLTKSTNEKFESEWTQIENSKFATEESSTSMSNFYCPS